MARKANKEPWLGPILRGRTHGIVALDGKGRVVAMNPTAETLTGRRHGQAVGQSVASVFTILSHEDRTPIKPPTLATLQKGGDALTFKHAVLVSAKGKETIVDVIATPTQPRGGGPPDGLVLIFRDVSKVLSEELEAVHGHRIAAIGNMAAIVAHNINDWLTVISGHASSIAENLLPNTRAHDEALKIVSATKFAGGLTKRLLSISRAAKTGGSSKVQRVALEQVVRQAITVVRGSFVPGRAPVSFRVGRLEATPYVDANEEQLTDCLVNLFLNAIEALPKGGTIQIQALERTRGERSFVILRVKDNGTGMPPDVVKSIFEPFFTTKDRNMAMGMGLTVVKSSLEQWGGFVDVTSAPGRGSRFDLYLPRAAAQPPRETRKAVTTGGEIVLLVDDDRECLAEMERMLKDAGFMPVSAGSADEAISHVLKYGSDIALSIIDVIMPKKDGKYVLERILEIDSTAAVIMTSGFSRDYVRSYLERGVWGYIQKPIDKDAMLALVRKTIEAKTAAAGSAAPEATPP